MKKEQPLLQRFKNWWYNLPHKCFLLFQLLAFTGLHFYNTRFLLPPYYDSVGWAIWIILIFALFYSIQQIFIVMLYRSPEISISHVFLPIGLICASQIVQFDFILVYLFLSLFLQCFRSKYFIYAVGIVGLFFAICTQFSVSPMCTCVPNTFCNVCMYDFRFADIPLFQITDKSFLYQIIRTKPW